MSFSSIQLKQTENSLSKKVDSLQRELNKLRSEFYSVISPGFKYEFTTDVFNSFTFTKSLHKLTNVTSVEVFNQNMERVSVYVKILSDQSVEIKSSLPLINYTVIIN